MANGHFFHDIKFDGKIENKEIINLNNEIKDLEYDIKRKLARIREIQNNCDHIFHFVAQGMHEDDYCCQKCGKEEEN